MKIAKISMKDVAFKENPLAQGCSVKRPEEFKKYLRVNPAAYLAPKTQYDACMMKDGVQLLQAKIYKFSDKSISMYVRCPVVHRVNFCPWVYQEDPTRPQLSYSDFELKLDIFETSKKAKLKRANAPMSEIRKASNTPEYFGSFVDLFLMEGNEIDPKIVGADGNPNFKLALVKVWNEFIVPGVKAGFLVECYSPTDISGVTRARALMHNIEEFMENTPEFTPKERKPQTLKKGLKMNLSSLFGSSELEEEEDEDVFTEDEENTPFDSDEEEYDDSEEEYEEDDSEYDDDEEEEYEEEEPQPVVKKTKTKTKGRKPMDEVLKDLAGKF